MFYIFWPFIFSGDVIKIYEVYLLNCIGNWWSPPGLSIWRWWVIVDSDMWWQGQVMILLPEWSYLFKGQSSSTFNCNPSSSKACSWDDGSVQAYNPCQDLKNFLLSAMVYIRDPRTQWSPPKKPHRASFSKSQLPSRPLVSWDLVGSVTRRGLIWKAERRVEMPHRYMTCSAVFTLTS